MITHLQANPFAGRPICRPTQLQADPLQAEPFADLLWQLGNDLWQLGNVWWQLGNVLWQLGSVLWQLGHGAS